MKRPDFLCSIAPAYGGVGTATAMVCTSLCERDALERVNRDHPTNLDRCWRLWRGDIFADHPNGHACCAWPKTHNHYLFVC